MTLYGHELPKGYDRFISFTWFEGKLIITHPAREPILMDPDIGKYEVIKPYFGGVDAEST